VSRYAVLRGRIQQQLQDLEMEYQYALDQAQLAETSNIGAYWIAAGFGLQGFYTGVEKIFEQIARSVDGSLSRESERWHQELLEQMRIEVPDIRPAVIEDETYRLLRTYLGFRHVLRNNYTHRLDSRLIAHNIATLPDCYKQICRAMDHFQQFLQQVDEAI